MKCYGIEGDFDTKRKFQTSSVEVRSYFKTYIINMSKLNLDALTAEVKNYVNEIRECEEDDEPEKFMSDDD